MPDWATSGPPHAKEWFPDEMIPRAGLDDSFLQSFRARWKQCTLTHGQAEHLDPELSKIGDLPKSPLPENDSLMPSAGKVSI
jgi:hypothetical protein